MILALRTDSDTTQIALFSTGSEPKLLAEEVWESGRQLADELPGKLQDFLVSSSEALSGIIIFSGPGSFTSLRIGHTVANALADSLNIPVLGARGERWIQSGLKAIAASKPGSPALPFYGADANISKPKT